MKYPQFTINQFGAIKMRWELGKASRKIKLILVIIWIIGCSFDNSTKVQGLIPPTASSSVVTLSSSKLITSFGFSTPQATGFITGTNITVTVPSGTIITSLVANFISTGASVTIGGTAQTSGTTANNFSSILTYTVIAEDSSSTDFIVTVLVASNTAKDITSFRFPTSVQTIFTGTNINVTVPFGTNLTNLIATFSTTGVSVNISGTNQISGTTSNDFSAPIIYTVVAGDTSTQNYTVTVTAASNSSKNILSFGFSTPSIMGSITGTNIAVTVPFGTSLSSLVAIFSTTGSNVRIGSTIQVSNSTANNFTSPLIYTVTAPDNSTQNYTVTVTVAASASSAIVNGSFQSGTITNTTSNSSATLSTPVDITKSFVYCGAKITGSSTANMITCQLSSPTTVTVQSGSAATGTTTNWFVVEYANGVSAQRGSVNFANGDSFQDITISTINQTNTFALVYSRTSDTSTNQDERRTVRAYFTSNTNLRIERQDTGTSISVEWQVVQMTSANVQSGTSTIANGFTNTTAVISSLNTSKSFLFFSYNGDASIGGTETNLYTRGTITNSNTLTFTRRGTSQSVSISWFAIEMTDGTTTQSGSVTIGANNGGTAGIVNVTANLGTPVNTSKSMIVWSNDTSSGDTAVASQDSSTYSGSFNSSSQLQFDRHNDENNQATIDWFAVEFQ